MIVSSKISSRFLHTSPILHISPESNLRPTVEKLNGKIGELIATSKSGIVEYLPREPEYGYVFKLHSRSLLNSTIEENVYYLLDDTAQKSLFLRLNLTLSKRLSLLLQKDRISQSEVWRGPPVTLHPGMSILPAKVISNSAQKQEVVLREKTSLIDLWYAIKRDDDTLFFITVAQPCTLTGYLLWKSSIEPMYPFVAKKAMYNLAEVIDKRPAV